MEKVFAVLTCINAFFPRWTLTFFGLLQICEWKLQIHAIVFESIDDICKKKILFELKETDVDLYLMPCLFLNISLNVN